MSYLTSGSFQGTIVNEQITAGIVNINTNNYYQPKIESNTTINNIHDIFALVDNNTNCTQEEKEEIKGAVTQIEKVITSLDRISDKAAPYVQLATSLIQKFG